jgi:hypothetical protein
MSKQTNKIVIDFQIETTCTPCAIKGTIEGSGGNFEDLANCMSHSFPPSFVPRSTNRDTWFPPFRMKTPDIHLFLLLHNYPRKTAEPAITIANVLLFVFLDPRKSEVERKAKAPNPPTPIIPSPAFLYGGAFV